jgi:hypothetical protein
MANSILIGYTVFVAINLLASTTTMQATQTTEKGWLERKQNPKYSRCPSRMHIEYEYSSSGIWLYPSDNMQSITALLSDCFGQIVTEQSLSPEIGYYLEINLEPGEYTITCTTDGGAVYEGGFTIE